MLLRSSSTPVLGSLLSSFSSESPNNSHHFDTNSISKQHYAAFHHQKSPSLHNQPGSSCLHMFCNSSPMSPSMSESNLRRVQSDGNLKGLAYYASSCSSNSNNNDVGAGGFSQLKKFQPARQKFLMLETIHSFSRNSNGRNEEEEDDDWDDDEEEEQKDCSFGLNNKMEEMGLGEKIGVINRNFNLGYFEGEKTGLFSEEMYLARGLGVEINGGSNDGNGGRGSCGGNGGTGGAAGDGGDINATELYYKKMVQENPSNSLFLSNYAQFLYKTKKDVKGAEEYYSRAILADPKDGEILSQYAKIVWELHNDEDRASTYFERAVQASPQDSHVHAAYASFLWETEEDDEDKCSVPNDFQPKTTHFNGVIA